MAKEHRQATSTHAEAPASSSKEMDNILGSKLATVAAVGLGVALIEAELIPGMLIGIGAPLNAIKTDAEGGWTMMSAPTPSVRFADSINKPLVNPTTMITRVTSTATAITVIAVRIGRCIVF